MSSIVDELKKLNRAEVTDPEHDCTAADVGAAVCSLLAETILKDEAETDKLSEWEDGIRRLLCDLIGEHTWTFDHCGYWGHQYCLGCHMHRYPELGTLRCSAAIEKVGNVTEDEYRRDALEST